MSITLREYLYGVFEFLQVHPPSLHVLHTVIFLYMTVLVARSQDFKIGPSSQIPSRVLVQPPELHL